MPKITFFVRKGNKDTIYCRVSINQTTCEFSTGENVSFENWSQADQKYRSQSKSKNNHINTLLETISYKLKQNAILKEYPTAKKLTESLKPATNKPTLTLLEIVTFYVESLVSSQKASTIINHRRKIDNLRKYQAHTGKVFDHTFGLIEAERFKEWFCKEKKTRNITSASRNIELYKNAGYFAVKKGLIQSYELAFYEPERDKIKTPVYLSEQEAEKIIKATFKSYMLERMRDLYLFQIFTGLSYSDIYGNWELQDSEAGKMIVGTRSKNNQVFYIPLDDVAFILLKKYQNKMPYYGNSVYNRNLKLIAKQCGIEKHLTTHSGRKTFATLKDQKGWSIESIAIMLGHTSIKTTETYYIGKSIKRLEIEMLKRKTG